MNPRLLSGAPFDSVPFWHDGENRSLNAVNSVPREASMIVKVLFVFICTFAQLCAAEASRLIVRVQDVQQRPIKGIEIGVEGIGGAGITGNDGKVVLVLGNGTRSGDWVSLSVLHSPPGKDFVIISPWDNRTIVPSFANKAENFVSVVVVQRGDRTALQSGTFLAAMTQKIIKQTVPKMPDSSGNRGDDQQGALEVVAKQYGLSAKDLDSQVRAWGSTTLDPYEVGLAALYMRKYPEATNNLQRSLTIREERLAADQRKVEEDRKAICDATFFLGKSLYEQGKYRESAQVYGKRLVLTPDDGTVINDLALDLSELGDYGAAEPLFHRALDIDQKALGPDHPNVATDLDNLGLLLTKAGHYREAEPLVQRAVDIVRAALGPLHPEFTRDLANLGVVFYYEKKNDEAEQCFRSALAIDETVLGPESHQVAVVSDDLAVVLKSKGDYLAAELLYRRALDIDEKALGPDHPSIGMHLNNLGVLLLKEQKYSEAEEVLNRALTIEEKALGPNHPNIALTLNSLSEPLRIKGDYTGAEGLLTRALAIDEQALGPEHPATKLIQSSLDRVQRDKASSNGH
jgi:tetratricopeptide (TPR) repeat protein